jgi:hypothetical protein
MRGKEGNLIFLEGVASVLEAEKKHKITDSTLIMTSPLEV